MFRRIGVALGAVAATLAFAASAQAAPSTPQLNPIPDYVCGSKPTVSWSKSTPDPVGTIVAYRLDIGDLTAGTATLKYVSGSTLSTQIGPLITGHHYVVRLRALQHRSTTYSFSGTSYDHFKSSCVLVKLRDEYLAYDPFRWDDCWVCGPLEGILMDDPVIYRGLKTAVAAGQRAASAAWSWGRRLRPSLDPRLRPLYGLRQPPAARRDQLVHLLRAV